MPSNSKLERCSRCGHSREVNTSHRPPGACRECVGTYDTQGRQEWMSEGRCHQSYGNDPDWWFPDSHGTDAVTQLALSICDKCPVIDECLAFALDSRQTHGIWGGMPAFKRASLLRSRRRLGT